MLLSRFLGRVWTALSDWTNRHLRRIIRIGGQGPKLRWKNNKGGLKRTIEEAVEIAKKHGVEIPEDVEFFEADPGELKGSVRGLFSGQQQFETAKGPDVSPRRDGRIYLADHYNIEGKIPFQVHPEVLTSDEAIVAVFQHEMYELSLIRDVFIQYAGSMNWADYGIQTSPGRPGNFHDLAWDEADRIVRRIRRRGQ